MRKKKSACSSPISMVQASVFVTDIIKKTPAYYEICTFSVNYESVMFYSSGPRIQRLNHRYLLI